MKDGLMFYFGTLIMAIGICVFSTQSRIHQALLLDATKSLCF